MYVYMRAIKMAILHCGFMYIVLILSPWGLSFPSASAEPLVNFLLTDYGYIYDVMQNTPQNNEQCGIGFGKEYISQGNAFKPLLLNGGTRPYVDVNIPTIGILDGPQYSDFTFRINIATPVDPPTGTVFHYLSNTCSIDKIDELKLWLLNGDLYASKRVGTNTPEVTVFSDELHRINALLEFLGLGVEASTGKLVIMVYSYTFKSESSSTPQKALNSPGVMRVGGGFDYSMGLFSGEMACLGLYQELLDANNKHYDTFQNCMTTAGWNSLPNGVPAAPDPTGCPTPAGGAPIGPVDRTNGFFNLAGNDMAPSCHVISTKSMIVDVSVKCAKWCLQDDTCLSFTVTTALSVNTCSLYPAVYKNLAAMSSTKYYTLIV